MKLENKIAIVTGSSLGIGKAIAEKFIREGAKVVFSDVNEIDNVLFKKCDVSKSNEVNDLINFCLEKFGGLDIMVNNAGIGTMADITTLTDEEWQKVIGINLSGVFYGARAASKVMKEGGSIINMSSILGSVGFANAVAYCAAKGGVDQITKAGALDLSKKGIRINSIAPGFIKTNMTKGLQEDEAYSSFINMMTPMGRMGDVEDIANAAVYLASSDSKYTTGTTLYVDGGYRAQ